MSKVGQRSALDQTTTQEHSGNRDGMSIVRRHNRRHSDKRRYRRSRPPVKLSAWDLKTILRYRPSSGLFVWAESRRGCVEGRIAGTLVTDPDTYRQHRRITINGKVYRAARLAWLYMTGSFPPYGRQVYHLNGDSTDDSWDNLYLR